MLSKSFITLAISLLAMSGLTGATPVAPAPEAMILHNARQAAPAGFKVVGPAPAEKTIDIRLALASNDIAGLEKALYDVSTPTSANYRKFLSKEQVSTLSSIS